MASATIPSQSAGIRTTMDKKLSRDLPSMTISNDEKQTNQSNQAPQRNLDVSQTASSKHPQLSTESQNHSEHVAARNLNASKWATNPSSKIDPQDHFVRRQDGGFKINDGNGPNHGNDENSLLEQDHDPNIPPIVRKPLPADSPILSDHTNHTANQAHYPLPTLQKKSVFETLKETRLPLAGTAGRELGYSEDVSQHTKQAEAVTHETVQPVIHHVEHEKITREIHDTHIVHRIQPINQIEYLPARHFVLLPNGTRKEVKEENVLKELGLT